MDRILANGFGFWVSTQVNFVLSGILTWGDRQQEPSAVPRAIRWLSFNVAAGAALAANESVFAWAISSSHLPLITASLAGVATGASLSFVINNFVTFRHHRTDDPRVPHEIDSGEESIPSSQRIWEASHERTLIFFLPAYREEANLPTVVGSLIDYLSRLSLAEWRIVIVNDGSPDGTGEVADELARQHPEVVIHHHKVNRGYGGALRSGFLAAVTYRTSQGAPFDLWAFSDSDGQFRPESLGVLLVAEHESGASLIVGRRHQRESQFRRWLGKAWHNYSGLILGRRYLVVNDVDCGLKLGHVWALSELAHKLFGQKAAISPELIVRSVMAGHHIVERTVDYWPRMAGQSTGANLSVMVTSGLHILKIGLALRIERWFGVNVSLATPPMGEVVGFDGISRYLIQEDR